MTLTLIHASNRLPYNHGLQEKLNSSLPFASDITLFVLLLTTYADVLFGSWM